MPNPKSYAGIGSRQTPANIREVMEQLAEKLARRGLTLRSGGADGADKAFEKGCDRVQGAKIIFTANNWYFRNERNETDARYYLSKRWEEAETITSQYHPSWQYLKPFSKKLHTRNCFQILGLSLNEPASFVLCWTPDGAKTESDTSHATGGTGQAIRVAHAYGVKVYNLANDDDLRLAQQWLTEPAKC